MTVAIGLVCSDGVIVASDSMSSTAFMTAHQGKKVNAVEELNLVWTASGSVYVIEEVDSAFGELVDYAAQTPQVAETFATPKLQGVRQNLGTYVRDATKKCYKAAMPGVNPVPLPGGSSLHPWNSDFLICGYANATPYFLEIGGDGQMNWHTAARFSATGSGGPFAEVTNGLMAHYVEGEDLPVKLGLWVAYRAIETTCRVSSSSVGLPVQMAVADDDGARVLSDEEVEEVAAGVEGWLTVEKDSLKQPIQPTGDARRDDVPSDELPSLED